VNHASASTANARTGRGISRDRDHALGRGSDAGRSEKWRDERFGGGLRWRRKHARRYDDAKQVHFGYWRRQGLEALGEACAHIRATGAGLRRLVAGHVVGRGCGWRRSGHGQGDRRRHRHGN